MYTSSPLEDGSSSSNEKHPAGVHHVRSVTNKDSGFFGDSPKDAVKTMDEHATDMHPHSSSTGLSASQHHVSRPLMANAHGEEMPFIRSLIAESRPPHFPNSATKSVIQHTNSPSRSAARPKSSASVFDKENVKALPPNVAAAAAPSIPSAQKQPPPSTTSNSGEKSLTFPQKMSTSIDHRDYVRDQPHVQAPPAAPTPHHAQPQQSYQTPAHPHPAPPAPQMTDEPSHQMEATSSSTSAPSNTSQLMFSQLRIGRNNYRVLRQIGSGGFSHVFAVASEADGRLYGLKQVRVPSERHLNDAMREADMLRGLADTGCVVRVFEVAAVRKKNAALMILMELGNADLASWMRSLATSTPPLPAFMADPDLCRSLFRQMAYAISILHSRGIVHNDLKPSNWLFTGGCRLKLIDFGVSRQLAVDTTSQVELDKLCGTLDYMSPERLSDRRTSPAGDVWALGCILHELVFGIPPFGHLTDALPKISAIAAWPADAAQIPYPPKHCLHECVEKVISSEPHLVPLIRSCLLKASKSRPTAAELLSHPFVVDPKHGDPSKSNVTVPEACHALRTAANRRQSGDERRQFVSSVLDFLLGNSQHPPSS